MSQLSKTDSFLAKGMPSSDGGEKERHLTIFSHALTMASLSELASSAPGRMLARHALAHLSQSSSHAIDGYPI